MSALHDLFSSSWAQALGWTLVYSLWQCFLCAIGVIVALRCIPSMLSSTRYLVAASGLSLMLFLSVGTFIYLNTATIQLYHGSEKSVYPAIAIATYTNEYPSINALSAGVKSFIQSNISLIVILWGAGALLFSLRIFGSWLYVRKLQGHAIRCEDEWSHRAQQLAIQLGINRIVTLVESARIQAPIVIGYFKPVILIPIGMCTGLTTDQLESIFIHELIHIRRGDFLVNSMQSFLEAFYFFNPFVWIVSGIVRREREHCCDDAVVRVHGNPLAYAHALTSLEEVRLSKSGLALSLAENKKQLLNRIKRIMKKSVKHYSSRERIVPVILLAIGLLSVSWITIQSGKSDADAVRQDNLNKAQIVASDTTVKMERSGQYSGKETTSELDVNTVEEIKEEVELDLPLIIEDMELGFVMPPIEEIVDIEVMLAPSVDFNFNMDSIPHPEMAWGGDHNWDEFSSAFEKTFKETFGDFYKLHEKQLQQIMDEMAHKFDHQFNEEWTENIHQKALKQEELASMLAQEFELNVEALALQEQYMEKLKQDMGRWEEEHAANFQEMEQNMKAVEESMKALEKELKEQLMKDGYLEADEKIERINMHDDSIEINGKTIKPSDQKKYKELLHKFSSGPTEVHKSSGRSDGRIE